MFASSRCATRGQGDRCPSLSSRGHRGSIGRPRLRMRGTWHMRVGLGASKGGEPMTQAQGRAYALGAARYYLRRMGVSPLEATIEVAHKALDDYARLYWNAYPSQWYHGATDLRNDSRKVAHPQGWGRSRTSCCQAGSALICLAFSLWKRLTSLWTLGL